MHPSSESRFARSLGPVGLCAVMLASMIGFSSIGLGTVGGDPATGTPAAPIDRWLGPTTVVWLVLQQGWMMLGFALAAFGWGRIPSRLLARDSINRHWIQIGLGLAVLLTLSHAAGMLGVLSGDGSRPRIFAWVIIALGLLQLFDQIVRKSLRPEHWPVVPWTAVLWGVPAGLLIVAACNPPGGLWETEFGSFDTLSYHLQLPKEWAAGSIARLWPVSHNVYSYLPSYMEAAYLHLSALQPGDSSALRRILGPEANWVVGAQLLHAALAIIAALLVGRCAWVISVQVGVSRVAARHLGVAIGALALATPWMTVIGSLAYNEAPMLALGAAALLCAMDTTLTPLRRAIACALLVGGATACKPTALPMFVPLVGMVMLLHTPGRSWFGAALIGSVVGVAMLLPWMVRNAIASGNPVFPFAPRVLGFGHWSAEQAAKYAENHGPDRGIAWPGRLARLLVERNGEDFGLSHPQWSWIGYLGLGLGLLALASRGTRTLGVLMLLSGCAMALVWMGMTHMQSRFLLPMLLPLAMLLTLGFASLGQITMGARGRTASGGVAGPMLAGVLAFGVSAFGAVHFAGQSKGEPNALLVRGPSMLSAMAGEAQMAAVKPEEQRAFAEQRLGPEGYINLILKPQEPPAVLGLSGEQPAGVYLLGDTAPLYTLGALGPKTTTPRVPGDYRAPVLYHTTWDASPLGDAVRADPDDPASWSAHLQSLGVGYVLVNFDELSRLIVRSKYFDRALSPEIVRAWLDDPRSRLTLVRAWPRAQPGTGRALYRFTNITPTQPALR